jgi:hypothetical protein
LKNKSERESKGTDLLRDFCLKERARDGVREKKVIEIVLLEILEVLGVFFFLSWCVREIVKVEILEQG